MTRSTQWAATEARARLRAADPAESGLDDELWPSATARATLERIVAEPTPGAAGTVDPRLSPVHPGFGRRVLPVSAVVIVLLVAAAVTLVRTIGGPDDSRPVAVGPSAPATVSNSTAVDAASTCRPALALAKQWGSGASLVVAYALTGAQLLSYVQAQAQAHAQIMVGQVRNATSGSLCIVDGSALDPPLPLAPGAPEQTYTRVSFVVTDGQATLFQVGSPSTISATLNLPGSSDAANKAAALAAVEKLLATAPTLPGAKRETHDPSGRIGTMEPGGDDNLVEKSAYWAAPGTTDAALGYLKAHLPTGWSVGMSGSSSRNGTPLYTDLVLDAPAPDALSGYAQPQVQFGVAPYHGGVAVLAEAQATWLPARTAAEQIPATATSVDVTVTRPGRDTVHRTLAGAALRQLADVVNVQPVATPEGIVNCPDATSELSDALAFHTSGTTVTVTAVRDGCSGVTVTADGKAQPALDGVDAIDSAVLAALGLPSAYRIN